MPPISLTGVTITLSTNVVVSSVHISTTIRRGQITDEASHQGRFEIRLPSTVLRGYITREISLPELSTGTAYSAKDVVDVVRFQFWMDEDLEEVKYPWPMIIHPNRFHSLLIESSIVKAIERRPARFDGKIVALDNFFYIGPELAGHLRKGPPVFTCRIYAGEMSDEQLVSYNPTVSSDKMKPLCEKANPQSDTRQPLTDEELNEFLKAENTFVFEVPAD